MGKVGGGGNTTGEYSGILPQLLGHRYYVIFNLLPSSWISRYDVEILSF